MNAKIAPLDSATLQWIADTMRVKATDLSVEALRVEASHRSFYRVAQDRETRVFMQSPPDLERNDQFVHMAGVFRAAGVPVPEVLAWEQSRGWLLLTDLGSTHFEQLYAEQETRDQVLQVAIDHLPRIAAIEDSSLTFYGAELLTSEMGIFEEWFLGHLLEHTGSVQNKAVLIESIDAQPKCCVHLDYHCRNLLFNDGQLGIVDFQDARRGPLLYDICSLLRDCYYTFSEADIDRWLAYFCKHQPLCKDIVAIKQAFDFTAIQRHLKAVGIFTRLHLRDAKSSHLRHIQPVLSGLVTLTAHYPELQALHKQLIDCEPAAVDALGRHV